MTKPMIKIHNAETGEIIEREMNVEELAQYKIDVQRDAQKLAEKESKENSKNAILERLGITADEAALLLQ